MASNSFASTAFQGCCEPPKNFRNNNNNNNNNRGNNPNNNNKNKVNLPNESIKSLEFIDSHVHYQKIFEFEKYNLNTTIGNNLNQLLNDKQNLEQFAKHKASINVNCWPDSFEFGLELQTINEKVFGTFGIHPHEAKFWNNEIENKLIECMNHSKTVAWGECGLDFFKNISSREQQINVCERQFQLAVQSNKPIVIHCRDAEIEMMELMQKNIPTNWNVHMHCFGSNINFANWLLLNYSNIYIGFTGAITFPNAADTRSVVEIVPINKLLLETDGPFMAPVPFRGQTAHPGHIPIVAQQVALIKNIPIEQVLQQTLQNTKQMYNLPF
eukprot:TRINITY_DN4_c0_g1_i5.p1 TRINITY_DN4_c0_g1~~TRINITY_DN4_c0_g1_i5.p1  ORF type:complete len:327 (-),score=149.50 TRINITY_DN4_c0_g1_i5:187-1167(-)